MGHMGHCIHWGKAISANTSKEWSKAVRNPCPHCGRVGSNRERVDCGLDDFNGPERAPFAANQLEKVDKNFTGVSGGGLRVCYLATCPRNTNVRRISS